MADPQQLTIDAFKDWLRSNQGGQNPVSTFTSQEPLSAEPASAARGTLSDGSGFGNSTAGTGAQSNPGSATSASSRGPGVLRRMLTSFSYNMGQSLKKSGGLPTDYELMNMQSMNNLRGAEAFHQLTAAQAQQMQTKMMGQMVQIQTPYGMANVPASVFANKILPAAIGGESRENVAKTNKRFMAVPNVGLVDTQHADGPSLVPGTNPQGVTITPEIAGESEALKQLMGKTIPLQQFSGLQRGEAFQNQVVPGAGGPVAVNKSTGVAKPVTLNGQRVGNPQVETAYARAEAGAKYGIAITDAGETTSRFNALTQGIRLASGNPLIRPGLKGYEDAYATDLRMKQMQQQAADPTGAHDMALLFNHIAMTGGNVKGMRVGELMTVQHMKARGIPEELGVLYNKSVNGQQLSPEQRQNFLKLATEVRQSQWQRAAQQGKAYGIDPSTLEQDPDLPHVDLSNYATRPRPNTPGPIKRGMGGNQPTANDPFSQFGGKRR